MCLQNEPLIYLSNDFLGMINIITYLFNPCNSYTTVPLDTCQPYVPE